MDYKRRGYVALPACVQKPIAANLSVYFSFQFWYTRG
jgi:hypothetical protein